MTSLGVGFLIGNRSISYSSILHETPRKCEQPSNQGIEQYDKIIKLKY